MANYLFSLGKNNIEINYSNVKRGLVSDQKVDDNYPTVSRGSESPMIGESMRFDLINKKGVIRKGKTNFDNGFYHRKIIQREEPDIMHVFNSKYT